MGLAQLKTYFQVEDYLAGENDGDIRHEYVYGEVYAMAGSSDRHNRISGNIFVKLLPRFSDSRECQVFITVMKLRADDATFYYPDVFVACDNPDPYFRREPILVVEVLSPSTESIDRREKLKVYRQIPSLIEYLIVAQDRVFAELHQKQSDGSWLKNTLTDVTDEIEFLSVGLKMTWSEMFRGVDFVEQSASETSSKPAL